MDIFLFSGVLVCLYFGAQIGFKIWHKKHMKKDLQYQFAPAMAAFVFIPVILGLACSSVIFGSPTLSLYTLISCAFIAVLYLAAQWPEQKKIWVPLVCASGTYLLHKFFPNIQFDWLLYCVVAVVWMFVMSLIMFFDKIPLLSFLTFSSWTFAFVAIILTGTSFPAALTVMSVLVFTPLWAVFKNSVQEMHGSLGLYASAFLGFVMGAIVAICVASGAYISATALMGYYLFEGLIFGIAYLGIHPFGMQRGDFALTTMFNKGNPTAIVKLVFYHLIILSLIAVLSWQAHRMLFAGVALVVIWMNLLNRFRTYGEPETTIRQVWKSTKLSLQSLIHSVPQHSEEISQKLSKPSHKKGKKKKK